MRRVALFPSAFHPSLGGVEELTGQLALQITRKGGSAIICTNQWPRTLAKRELWKGITVHRFAFRMPEDNLRARLSFVLSGGKVLNAVIGTLRDFRAEVVHIQCISSNGWYAARAAEALGLPLVVSTQGERTMDAGGIFARSPLYNRILRDVLGRADWVTACSMATLSDLEGYWGRPFSNGKSVVYNGVGSDAFSPAMAWSHTTPYLFALGRLVPQKGFCELLKAFAFAELPEVDLLLAGEGTQLKELTRMRDLLGLAGRVHFVGRADRSQVRSLLAGSIGLVVPSLREPMGIVALEGMASGKPVVISDVDGLSEVVPLGVGTMRVPPADVHALARGLVWLASRQGKGVVAANRRHAASFLWEQIAQEYAAIYENVCESHFIGSQGPVAGVRSLTF